MYLSGSMDPSKQFHGYNGTSMDTLHGSIQCSMHVSINVSNYHVHVSMDMDIHGI